MPSLYIKNVPEDLYQKLEEMARATGRSKQDIVIEALQLRIFGQQAKPDTEMVEYTEPELRQLLFPAKCAKCGKTIPAGEVAWLSKAKYADGSERWLAWHFDCLLVDKKLAKLYVKRRQLEKVIKALKKQADELADALIEAEARKKVLEIVQEILEAAKGVEKTYHENMKMLKDYLFTVGETQDFEEIKALVIKTSEESYFRLNEAVKKLDEVLAALASVKPRKGKKASKEVWR